MRVRIGTRNSVLARTQSGLVGDALRAAAGGDLDIEFVEIVTHGDMTRGSLVGLSETGVFVTALRQSLLDGECDILVHSLKDMPVAPYPGLHIAALPERADARDALCAGGVAFADLPQGARIGTSSPRRAAQVRALRRDLEVLDVRGNVDSRLARIGEDFDAVILAAAGLARIGRLDEADRLFSVDELVPAPGQGALAIEVRDDAPEELLRLVTSIDHPATRAAVSAERAALAVLDAGCAAPMGAHATVSGSLLTIRVRVSTPDGSLSLNERAEGPVARADAIGRMAAHALMGRGARSLMDIGRP